MMTGDQQLVEVEDYETTNIQLGIFIPSQTPLRKKAKKLKTALQPETNGAEEGDGETSGRRRRKKRNRLDSEDSSTDSTPIARPTDIDVDSRPTEIDVDSEQIPNNKKRKKKKRKKKKHTSETSEEDRESGVSDRDRALEYLRRWDRGSDGWSFRKKTQYWLLQNAYDKTKVPKAEFKVLLRYLEPLKGNQRQLAIARAQEVLSTSQHTSNTKDGSESNGSASRRMHKRARAVLRVLS